MLKIKKSNIINWARKTRPNFKNELKDTTWWNAFVTVFIHDILGYTFAEIEKLNYSVIEESEG